MFGFYRLVEPGELTRDDLPQVLRPFWAIACLSSDGGDRERLLSSYRSLDGCYYDREDDHLVQARLEEALESGRLIMLASERVTFDPVVSGQGDALKLQPGLEREPTNFHAVLQGALSQHRLGSRRQQPQPEADASPPLSFEESVAANKQFFGQPVSAFEPRPIPHPVAAPAPAQPEPAPPASEPLVIHFEMDIHAPANRNDSLTLRTLDGSWQQTLQVLSMNYVQDHWLELVFDDVPVGARFELIQNPNEPDRSPAFVFHDVSYAALQQLNMAVEYA